MIVNRSVPADIILPHIVYDSVEEALAWLAKAFGFREHYRYGAPGEASGAQIYLGRAFIMLKRARAGSSTPASCTTEGVRSVRDPFTVGAQPS